MADVPPDPPSNPEPPPEPPPDPPTAASPGAQFNLASWQERMALWRRYLVLAQPADLAQQLAASLKQEASALLAWADVLSQ